ncbi:hypothetical protein MesoLjLc_50540 [Mesorhizobium sp. L-8-10]|uniref:DUF4082 domain-containing protein n=1 Tax=Mesorhizobium sp. L-8-10 TaxID=2744523 RepID=UPI001926627A|nr:DUF4082 domain-containing protein [Mesorhizobium sp. L-8-10]BCH33124.1 hypothetical protein MesoLjLc_50540 [Mesorhizobium sp. L-8-10]
MMLGLGLRLPATAMKSAGGAPQAAEETIFDHSTTTYAGSNADSAVSLGIEVMPLRPGEFTKVYFWKTAADVATSRSVALYSTSGTLLGSGETVDEAAGPGWVECELSSPVWRDTAESVVAVVHFPEGDYAAQAGVFSSAGIYSGDYGIYAQPTGDAANGNNAFNYGPTIEFANSTGNGASYGIDAGFVADALPAYSNLSVYPNAGNTGTLAGASLDAWTGPTIIGVDHFVIYNKTITTPLEITGDDFQIINCLIDVSSGYAVSAENAGPVIVRSCTIVGPGASGLGSAGILASGTVLRNDISGFENGIIVAAGATSATIKDNYVHDLDNGGVDPHYDGISLHGLQSNVTIQNNTVIGRDTSDIFIQNNVGAIDNVDVNGNFLGGDPGFNIYVEGPDVTNVTIRNNRMVQGGSGYFAVTDASPTVEANNIDDSTGNVIPYP